MANVISSLVEAGINVNTDTKQPVWIALADIDIRNMQNEKLYDTGEIATAMRIKACVELAFPYKRVYLNYRQKFIAIKVEHLSLSDAHSLYADKLEQLCAMENVSIGAHGTNVIFRVTKQ